MPRTGTSEKWRVYRYCTCSNCATKGKAVGKGHLTTAFRRDFSLFVIYAKRSRAGGRKIDASCDAGPGRDVVAHEGCLMLSVVEADRGAQKVIRHMTSAGRSTGPH
jgi:hypothetical protein